MMRNRGLVQIPIMIGLLLMAVAVPAATKLVQQISDTRNQASGCVESDCQTICIKSGVKTGGCVNGSCRCDGSVPSPGLKPTNMSTPVVATVTPTWGPVSTRVPTVISGIPVCLANTIAPASGSAPLKVTLFGAGSAGNGPGIDGYRWDVNGDGMWETDGASLEPMVYVYTNPGVYRPKYQVHGINSVWSEVCDYGFNVAVLPATEPTSTPTPGSCQMNLVGEPKMSEVCSDEKDKVVGEIKYRYVQYVCGYGTKAVVAAKQGGPTSCKPGSLWVKYAKIDCAARGCISVTPARKPTPVAKPTATATPTPTVTVKPVCAILGGYCESSILKPGQCKKGYSEVETLSCNKSSDCCVPNKCQQWAKGDINCNGKIDTADMKVWQVDRNQYLKDVAKGIKKNYKSDLNNNGAVDMIDFNLWKVGYLGGLKK